MALNIRKVVAQRAENNQKIYQKDNFYILDRNCLFSLIQDLCPGLIPTISQVLIIKISIT